MSDEKRSQEEDLEAVARNIDALDSQAKAADAAKPEAPAAAAAPAAEEEEDDGEDDEDDAATPAAIARRVAALGADDATEALARDEERKLAERRAAKKKGSKKKSGLEAAASKRLDKIGARAEPRRNVAVASDADPLIEQTTKLSDWAKKNQKTVQIVGGLLTVALLGVAGYLYYDHKRETDASVILAKAIDVQHAKIGEPKKDEDDDDAAQEKYFKTYDDRRAAALKDYQEVESKFPGTGAAILARLAEGSLQLDKKDADKALAAFNDVKNTALAAADTEVKGRALEGVGFAYEMKSVTADKDKNLDAALAAFKEMENAADVKGFKEMAMYHQARVLMEKGDTAKAKETLLSLKERLDKPEDPIAPGLPPAPQYPYLKDLALDRLREIDPAAAPKPKAPPMGMGGHGGGQQFSPEQIKKLMEQMQKGQQK